MRTGAFKKRHAGVPKFAELQTIRQVLVWCRQETILLPALGEGTTAKRIIWRLPVYPTVHHMLTNPVYAGAYAFGRRTARVTIENGRKRVVRSMQRDWRSWEGDFLNNVSSSLRAERGNPVSIARSAPRDDGAPWVLR